MQQNYIQRKSQSVDSGQNGFKMKKLLKVYIASPYTNGVAADNVRRQLDAQKVLMDNKFVPFAPLLAHFSAIHHYRPEREWLSWDLEWLKCCDFLIRIRPTDGDGIEVYSNGSDIEEQTASENNIPVYNFESVEELKIWLVMNESPEIRRDIAKLLNKKD